MTCVAVSVCFQVQEFANELQRRRRPAAAARSGAGRGGAHAGGQAPPRAPPGKVRVEHPPVGPEPQPFITVYRTGVYTVIKEFMKKLARQEVSDWRTLQGRRQLEDALYDAGFHGLVVNGDWVLPPRNPGILVSERGQCARPPCTHEGLPHQCPVSIRGVPLVVSFDRAFSNETGDGRGNATMHKMPSWEVCQPEGFLSGAP